MKLVRFNGTGGPVWINPDNILGLGRSAAIGEVQVMMIGGLTFNLKDPIEAVVAALGGPVVEVAA